MEIEMKMEAVEVLPLAGDDVAPVLGEDFSVDDLLNFGGDEEGDDQTARHNEREKAKEIGGENSNSSFSSAVSFEATPVPELTADEVAELEWVSRIMDESESQREIPKMYTFALKSNHSQQQLQQQSPVQPLQVPVKAKRSKRTRSLSICWSSCSGGTPLPTSPSSSQSTTTTSTTTLSSTSSPAYYYHSSQPIYAHSSAAFDEMPEFKNHPKPKKRGHKPKQLTLEPTNGERRCSHCGVNSTPQWRTGPMGPKTLCNACGVRYKSGRLLPEYRPACSPTFLSHVHSNSHRKVLEMRRKKEEQKKPVYF